MAQAVAYGLQHNGQRSFAFGGRSLCVPSACTARIASSFSVPAGATAGASAAVSVLSYKHIRPAAPLCMTHCAPRPPRSSECRRVDLFNHSP
jgi:hypothetical protein